ncbi:MAG: hypothetical protein C0467_30160 [Planctomycetaceae bacterium]|nr:hypothetical protein [Planctomycetaceae bacterium]
MVLGIALPLVALLAAVNGASRVREAVAADAPANPPVKPAVVWPLERTAYFVGERVPLAFAGIEAGQAVKLEAVNRDGTALLHDGPAAALMLDAAKLLPGDYTLSINGVPTGQRLTITGLLRKSAGSMQDEATPNPNPAKLDKKMNAEELAAEFEKHATERASVFRESGLTACVGLGVAEGHRAKYLDIMAREGAMLLLNPDTRPTSFNPVGNHPAELEGMSQRMVLSAQANGRYPNFGGFCIGWDTCGFQIAGRKGLMTYWSWGNNTQPLRNYIERIDKFTQEEFTRRTGFQPVSEAEYIAYLLSIKRPEFAPAIDLTTKVWLAEIAKHTKPMSDDERVKFEKRLDAWSAYLMGMYHDSYEHFAKNLRAVDPTLRNTSSVQIDHAAVRYGQYTPTAYEPLDFQYQSTWNDQVGGPDYAYQWLLTAGLLDMHRGGKPTWVSNTMGPVHGRANFPGKFTRLAAHGLPWGVSGIGFALEGFSNILGGMNGKQTGWENVRGQAGEADVLAGREFLDRFAALAVKGRGDHGVGILYSKSQFQRQHIMQGFGTAGYKAFVTLTRLGYTPRFVTEEDLAAGRTKGLAAIVLIGQTIPLVPAAGAGLEQFSKDGGHVLVDGGTTLPLAYAKKLDLTIPFLQPGKPHSWSSPNIISGDNDTYLYARWYPELATAFTKGLGDLGRGVLKCDRGNDSNITLTQIDGGIDAKYVIAINESHVRTQADWHQVQERIVPTGKAPANAVVYDCTQEKLLGPIAPFDCDLKATTARVFAVLARPADKVALTARQKLTAGEDVAIAARVLDAAGKPIKAVVPLHVTLTNPKGTAVQSLYRSTDREGDFALSIPLGVNVPAGRWTVQVRSQLDGMTAVLPIEITAAAPGPIAQSLDGKVFVRDRAGIEEAFVKGAKFVLPIFDSPQAEQLLPIAEKVKSALATRGVDVEIRVKPEVGTHWLAYDPDDTKKAENARADAGELISKIKRETSNGNDWYSGMSGYRFGKPVILLDLPKPAPAVVPPPAKGKPAPKVAPIAPTNPMVNALADEGLLWPQASAAFPGAGRGVVQAVRWAFAPKTTAVVLQANDAAGLLAVVESLTKLPDDVLTPGVHAVRAELWKQYHVGGQPASPKLDGLTATGLQTSRSPQPFAIRFGNVGPVPADQVVRPKREPVPAVELPATFLPKQYVLHYRDDAGRFIETATVEFLKSDLRFSEAVVLPLEVAKAGKVTIVADGLFRYSDRKPMWQAQWEDIIELREKLVPKERRPLEIEVRLGDKVLGKLTPSRVEEKEVRLELRAPSAAEKPKTAVEEVVTRLSGEIELPAGRQEIMLIHRNIVDGQLTAVGVGMIPELPAPQVPKKK